MGYGVFVPSCVSASLTFCVNHSPFCDVFKSNNACVRSPRPGKLSVHSSLTCPAALVPSPCLAADLMQHSLGLCSGWYPYSTASLTAQSRGPLRALARVSWEENWDPGRQTAETRPCNSPHAAEGPRGARLDTTCWICHHPGLGVCAANDPGHNLIPPKRIQPGPP